MSEDQSAEYPVLADYEKLEKLGNGSYGDVYRARDKRTGELVALKQIRPNEVCEGISTTTIREASLLQAVNHINLVSVKDVIVDDTFFSIVTEHLDTDLYNYFSASRKGLSKPLLKSYAFQLLCGVAYLHSHLIIHRDLKTQNLLINSEGLLKICDFGLGRSYLLNESRYTPSMASLLYRAPEILLLSEEYTASSDMWSVGCIIGEMVHGKPIFPGESEIDQLNTIFKVIGTPKGHPLYERRVKGEAYCVSQGVDLAEHIGIEDPQLADLISKILVFEPNDRLTAFEAIKHPFFEDVPNILIEKCLPSGAYHVKKHV